MVIMEKSGIGMRKRKWFWYVRVIVILLIGFSGANVLRALWLLHQEREVSGEESEVKVQRTVESHQDSLEVDVIGSRRRREGRSVEDNAVGVRGSRWGSEVPVVKSDSSDDGSKSKNNWKEREKWTSGESESRNVAKDKGVKKEKSSNSEDMNLIVAESSGLRIRSPNGLTQALFECPGVKSGRRFFNCTHHFSLWHRNVKVGESIQLSFDAFNQKASPHHCRLLDYSASMWVDIWRPIGGTQELVKARATRVVLKFAYPHGERSTTDKHFVDFEWFVFDHALAVRAVVPPQSPAAKSLRILYRLKFWMGAVYAGSNAVVYSDQGDEKGYLVLDTTTKHAYGESWRGSAQSVPLTVTVEEKAGERFKKRKKKEGQNQRVAFTFTEACNYHTQNMLLSQLRNRNSFASGIMGIFQRKATKPWTKLAPLRLPYYVFMLGTDSLDLVQNQVQLGSLCELPRKRYQFKEWVKPGKALRDVRLSTDSVRDLSSFAQLINASYILLDAGWYGNERSRLSNPLTPKQAPKGEALDILEAVKIAEEKGVGLIMYVNDIALRQNALQIFDQLVTWGVKGIKMGFVTINNSEDMVRIVGYLRECASRRLIVNIHDAFRDYGIHRTFPNLVSVEGIRGDEHPDNTPEHVLTLPYTRMMGVDRADYTFTLDYKRLAEKKQGILFQIAAPFVLYNGLLNLNWYLVAATMQSRGISGVIGLWARMPASWTKTVFLTGQIGKDICIGRRTHEGVWFVACLSAVTKVQRVSFTFLDIGVSYLAKIYHGSNVKIPETENEAPLCTPLLCLLDQSQVSADLIDRSE